MMINCDYILLILNCKIYEDKSLMQKKSWLSKLPDDIIYFHVIGDIELEEQFTFDHYNHILKVKTKDDYISLPHKVIDAYNAIKKTYIFKYIFKTDDDQKLILPKFFETIKKKLILSREKYHYGGYKMNIHDHISDYYLQHPELPKNIKLNETVYCTGRFYFLSPEAVDDLLSKSEHIKKEYFEDYAIGYHLDYTYKTNILFINTLQVFCDFSL
jgi:hypothetical protein